MGMYDTVFVAQSLIEKAVKGTDIALEPFNGYHDFQTKDLDNLMHSFYIRDDGSFVWEKCEYKYIEPKPDSNKKFNWGHFERVGDPVLVEDTRTVYVDIYDLYTTEEERIFVTFTAHLKNGKLVEDIKIKSIERTNLEEEAIKNKKHREEWNMVTSTWQWRLATFLNDSRYKIYRFFYPLIKRLDDFQTSLREEAKSKVKQNVE